MADYGALEGHDPAAEEALDAAKPAPPPPAPPVEDKSKAVDQ